MGVIVGDSSLYASNTSVAAFVKLVSNRDLGIYQMLNFFIITSCISAFGVVANVMNIIVFYKQGFSNTMNISFCGLAVADLCGLVTMLWFNVILSGLLIQAGLNMSPPEMQYLTAGFPHICFARITSWITVFITAERCLCITLPLKIKQIITPRRTTTIIIAIYILIILSFEPEYQIAYIDWRFDINMNITILGLFFRSNTEHLQGVSFFLYAILGFASFITVIVFTLVLVIQLNKKSKWRKKANIDKTNSESISTRDRKTMTMVVMIATVLIICYTPGVAVSSASFFEPEFSIFGHYVNAFFTAWSFVFIFEAFNSSVNIFLYYHMSTKYRETFQSIFATKAIKSDEL